MCLDIIETTYPKGIRAGFGYKVFYSYDKKLFGEGLWGDDKERPANVWLKEKDYREDAYKDEKYIINAHFVRYRHGFHIFLYLKDAQIWCSPNEVIKKVQYRKAGALGYQTIYTGRFKTITGRLKTIVAKEIKILDEEIK